LSHLHSSDYSCVQRVFGCEISPKAKRKRKRENTLPSIFPSFMKKLAKCQKKMWKMFRHKLDFGFSLVAFLLDQCFFWWQISQLGEFFFPVRK
jgi:hypothetical protein